MAILGNQRWSRSQGAILAGLLLLTSLGGCQWCPSSGDKQVGGGNPAATPAPAGHGGNSHQPTTNKQGRAEALHDAERGQKAMVRCLQSERALTDGNELRCEDWNVVREEFLKP